MIQLKNSVQRSQTALGVFSLIAVSLIVLNLLTPIQAANVVLLPAPQLIVATRNNNKHNNYNNNYHKVATAKQQHSESSSSGSSVVGMQANDRHETVPAGTSSSPSDPYAFLREIYLDTEHKAITMILPHDEKQTIKDDKKHLLSMLSDTRRGTNGDKLIKRSINSGDNDYLSELTKLIYLKEARFYNLPHSLQQLLFKRKHYNNNNNNNYHPSVQKFLPNGRYGRRSDPSLQASSSLDFGTSRSELGKLRSLRDQLTRHSEFDSSQDNDNNALGQQFVKLITTSIPANKQQSSSLLTPTLSSGSKLLDCSYSGLSNLFWCNSVVSSNL